MAKHKTIFDESAILNNSTYVQYLNRLTELSIAMFEWKNLPDTIDPRFLELTLFTDGQAVFFNDEEIGFLCLQMTVNGGFDVYRIPTGRNAFAVNGYNRHLTNKDSVIIWNNMLHQNSILDVKMFARRLYNIDRTIDVNINAQKTPVLIQASEKQRLTMLNLYKEYDGNAPYIFGDKNLDINGLKVLTTNAPFVADKLYLLKSQIWNEALTYLGISNLNINKRERLLTDEVMRYQGGTIASRYSRLESRRQAAEQINEMFDLDIEVNYREDYQTDESEDYEFIDEAEEGAEEDYE